MLQHMSWVFLCFGQSISSLTSLCSLKRIEPSMSATLIPSHHGCGIISPHYSRHMEGQVPLNSAPTVFGKWLRPGTNIVLRPRQGTLHSTVWRALFNILYVLTSLWKLPRSAVSSGQNILGPDLIRHAWQTLNAPTQMYLSWDHPGPTVTPVWSPIPDCYLYGSLFFSLISGILWPSTLNVGSSRCSKKLQHVTIFVVLGPVEALLPGRSLGEQLFLLTDVVVFQEIKLVISLIN